MRVLITCGPTWVKIDDVRVISNHSSGEMGHLIADACVKQGLKVTLLEGQTTHAWSNPRVKRIRYSFFDELSRLFKLELTKRYDCVIHAAAVSDFVPRKRLKGKIDSSKGLRLDLIKAPKLIDQVKKNCPGTFLVGFKLEPGLTISALIDKTKGLFIDAQCDLVLANSIDQGYRGLILDADGRVLAKAVTKKKIAEDLVKILV